MKYSETLCSGMIRNAMCLRFRRGWSKLIRIGEQCIRNDDGVLTVGDKNKKRA